MLIFCTNIAVAKEPNMSKEKKICKPVKSTVSRIPMRECRTREQWDSIAKEAQMQAEEAARQSLRQGENPG